MSGDTLLTLTPCMALQPATYRNTQSGPAFCQLTKTLLAVAASLELQGTIYFDSLATIVHFVYMHDGLWNLIISIFSWPSIETKQIPELVRTLSAGRVSTRIGRWHTNGLEGQPLFTVSSHTLYLSLHFRLFTSSPLTADHHCPVFCGPFPRCVLDT